MDPMIYELLVGKIDSVKEELKEDIHEIKEHVNELLAFKWKVVGMAVVVGVIGAAVFELIINIIHAKGG